MVRARGSALNWACSAVRILKTAKKAAEEHKEVQQLAVDTALAPSGAVEGYDGALSEQGLAVATEEAPSGAATQEVYPKSDVGTFSVQEPMVDTTMAPGDAVAQVECLEGSGDDGASSVQEPIVDTLAPGGADAQWFSPERRWGSWCLLCTGADGGGWCILGARADG